MSVLCLPIILFVCIANHRYVTVLKGNRDEERERDREKKSVLDDTCDVNRRRERVGCKRS